MANDTPEIHNRAGINAPGIRDQAQRGVDLDGCALATLSSRAGRPPGRGCLVWAKAAGSNWSVESRAERFKQR
jgi:hypothetical protein